MRDGVWFSSADLLSFAAPQLCVANALVPGARVPGYVLSLLRSWFLFGNLSSVVDSYESRLSRGAAAAHSLGRQPQEDNRSQQQAAEQRKQSVAAMGSATIDNLKSNPTMTNLIDLPDPKTLEPLTLDDFAAFYKAVHSTKESKRPPFDWQKRLASQVCQGRWPDYLKLPTSSGKTAAIDIAVFALAYQACEANRTDNGLTAARRIFFVVDRRIIVNEAYLQTRKMAQKLWDVVQQATSDADPILLRVASWLRVLANDPGAPPLDCHELRGGIYRDDAWVRSPLQPTVLTSTVDQIGSRMLFRGYGVSDRNQPIHAAMTTCDSLIILDEAHCSRPFSQTVESIARYRGERWAEEPISTPLGLVQMTATPPERLDPQSLFTLEDTDYQKDRLLEQRHACAKITKLDIEASAKGKSLPAKLGKRLVAEANALAEKGCRKIAVVVNRIAIAREAYELLKSKHGERAALMIGRMRPLDRDELTGQLQSRFGSGSGATCKEPHFVVATQCMEVGADLDFDGMVTQCASLDALRQRFGRLNRLGEAEICHGAVIVAGGDVIEESKLKQDKPVDIVYGNALARTWNWLQEVKNEEGVVDFGIKAMERLVAESEANLDTLSAPSPDAPVLMPAHVDMLCQTSPRPALEPKVSDLLHGPDRGIPEVRICWRADLKMEVASEGKPLARRARLWHEAVAACPPSSAECLSVPVYILRKWLRGENIVDTTSDVLGETEEDDTPDKRAGKAHGRCAMVWRPDAKSLSNSKANQKD